MNGNIRIIYMRSSFLTAPLGIFLLFAAAAGMMIARLSWLSGFLILLGTICLISRQWALKSLEDVRFEAASERMRFFPGDEFSLDLRVENDKSLPMIWMDAVIPLPEGCPVMPRDASEICQPQGLTRADEELPDCPMLRRRFAFLMPHAGIGLPVEMSAVRRGIFSMDSLRLYSGDGFGLTQAGITVRDPDRVFAVYPKTIPVRTELLLRDQWMSSGRSKGYMEDITLIRGSRDYQMSDSWKRINWRMAARGMPLTVNLPEMILPQSSHFIVDGESFGGEEPDDEGFELMLSILASVLIRLDRAGVGCGLTLPASLRSESVTCPPGTATDTMLYALAAYERKIYDKPGTGTKRQTAGSKRASDVSAASTSGTEENRDSAKTVQPVSSFDTAAAFSACRKAGSIWYLTKSLRTADNALLRRLGRVPVTILPLDEPAPEEKAYFDGRVLPLRTLLSNNR